jgi:predicted small metal-binding protein
MKRLKCKDLGGACDVWITGSTPEDIGNNCTEHARKMIRAGDSAHIEAARKMNAKTPEEFQEFLKEFNRKFEEAEEE